MITKVFVGGSEVDKSPSLLDGVFSHIDESVDISVSAPNQQTCTINRPVPSGSLGDYILFGVVKGNFTINMGSGPKMKLIANIYHVFTGLDSNKIKTYSNVIEYRYYHKPGSNLYVGIITANGIRADNVQLSSEYLEIIKPEFLTEVITINNEMNYGNGLMIEWINGKTSAILKGGYTHEQQITTGSYIMEVSANTDNGAAGTFVITYNNNASTVFVYNPIIIGNPITCFWVKNTGVKGFVNYINEQVQPQIDAIEAEILPISQKLDVARDLFTTR